MAITYGAVCECDEEQLTIKISSLLILAIVVLLLSFGWLDVYVEVLILCTEKEHEAHINR